MMDFEDSEAAEEVVERIVVDSVRHGQRLDRMLSVALDGLSRQRVKALILEGAVKVDDAPSYDPSGKVRSGSVIEIAVPPPADAVPRGEAIELTIAYEDKHLLVVDKPPGLVVHPAPGHEAGTLVNALIAHCGAELSGIGGIRRPGIVHRLDKDTSGLLVVAKTDPAHQGLSRQFQSHGADGRLQRAYQALVWGRPERPVGRIEAAIGRSTTNRRKMAVAKAGLGRHAATRYRVIETAEVSGGSSRPGGAPGKAPGLGPAVTLMQLELETGRTHQIRVHLASVGHPLLGDRVYGAGFLSRELALPPDAQAALHRLGRQALHAAMLGFEHPVTGEPLVFESALPPDIASLKASLPFPPGI